MSDLEQDTTMADNFFFWALALIYVSTFIMFVIRFFEWGMIPWWVVFSPIWGSVGAVSVIAILLFIGWKINDLRGDGLSLWDKVLDFKDKIFWRNFGKKD